MRNFYITLSAFLAVATFYAQNNTDTELDKKVLKQALIYADSDVAKKSMYDIIAKEGENSTYKDSLAYLYFNDRRFSSCFMVCTDILSRDGSKQEILEMQAISLENMGAYEKAAQSYAKLTVKTKNNYHAYKLANLYYAIKKYDEAYKAIQKALELKDTGEIKVTYAVNKNYQQQVALLAAISNLKGLIEFEQDKMDLAKASFQKAVEIQEDFVLAKENLQAVIDGNQVKKE
ncbi:hypothetical protein EGM88_06145 [Aureibaculum marinum]|uniref:Tetratricopeptide repeat protein n=1 Tax=Aureibaculum marinum TaxID=2487930 RepID=A0A3N4NVN6_9FLAO|nr:hypothetical protein [Aureibaculum marinum]RPD98767.1 hypothetical protein EGM88_06145 [Aureibaculum marinum]